MATSGDLPIPRNLSAVGRPLAPVLRRPAAAALARKSILGLASFALLIVLCLFDMNTVAYNLWGVNQAFSIVILVLCIVVLLLYRLTVYRDLGTAGRLYVLFFVALVAIGTPIGLSADPEGILGRSFLIRLLLASLLIVMAAAVAARSVFLAYGVRFTLGGLFLLGLVIPLGIWISSYYPEFYRVRIGESRDLSRATGTYNNPNEAGAAVCMFAAMVFAYMMSGRSKLLSTVLVVGALMISALAILLTASRGAFVVFALVSLAQVVISPGSKKLVLSLAAVAVVAGMAYAVFSYWVVREATDRSQVERFESLGRVIRGEVTDETTGGRFELAMNGIREWQKSPLLGNGLGTQRRVGAANIGPHNTYILIAGEAGIVPLALYLLMIAAIVWQGWKCPVPAIRTFAMTFGFVLALGSLTAHGVLQSREYALMMGLCFGFLSAAHELKAAERSRRPPPPFRPPVPRPLPSPPPSPSAA
ncbi:MAG: hypothetical protein DCC68_09270 [Planctomycetota bacterium]|nr:MAG: hypothetical protein DCC68_09270 [Planctomycetota bacterium]